MDHLLVTIKYNKIFLYYKWLSTDGNLFKPFKHNHKINVDLTFGNKKKVNWFLKKNQTYLIKKKSIKKFIVILKNQLI